MFILKRLKMLPVRHTSPHRSHAHMLCCRITTLTFYIFNKFLKSVTLRRNIRAPWRWSEWWSKHVGAFL